MPTDLLVIDVAHAFWAAWHARSNAEPGTAPIDRAATDVYRLAQGWPHVVLAVDAPPYLRARVTSDMCEAEQNARAGYKAHRVADAAGRDALRRLLARLDDERYPLLGVPGHEADDVCATLARLGPEQGVAVTIATGDKDLWTLVGRARVVDMRGEPVTPEAIAARFEGALPEQLGDLLAISGDKSDGIAGVPQLGDKRAANVLRGYGSLAAILATEPIGAETLAAERRTLDALRKGLAKAKKKGGDESGASRAVEDTARRVELLAQHARVHEFRAAVELASKLVRLVDDLPIDLAALLDGAAAPPVFDHAGVPADPIVADLAARESVPRSPSTATSSRPTSPTPREDRRPMNTPRAYDFHATDATRESILLRAGFCGPTGSGKTKTGMILATRMVERLGLGPLFVIDSENKSALRYAYSPRSRQGYRFKHVAMPEDDYGPAAYMGALEYCEAQGAGVILIDSLSHAWNGINGVLEQVDQVTANSRSKNQFSEGWKAMTPVHNRLIQRMLGSSAHIIFTLRAKVDWVVEKNSSGKMEPQKVGLAPIQREGVDYEPDLFFDMTVPDNGLVVSKSRCDRLTPGEVVRRPGVEFADVIVEWIEDSEPPAGARTLGEAVNQAVAEGILAAEEKSPDRYKEAKRKLIAWCESSGVAPVRRDVALGHFKERVSIVAGPKSPAPDPPADGAAP